jgi:hypothetical protein
MSNDPRRSEPSGRVTRHRYRRCRRQPGSQARRSGDRRAWSGLYTRCIELNTQTYYSPGRGHPQGSRAQVAAFFAGLDLIPPGVKPAGGLRPGWGDAPNAPGHAYVLGGIGRRS